MDSGVALPPALSLERTSAAGVRGLVVLLHHFGGNRTSLMRWRQFYLDLGFDVLCRDFGLHGRRWWRVALPIRPLWERECAELLARGCAANRGATVTIHALSSFCAVLLRCLSSSTATRRIDAVVCENGPFLDAVGGIANMLREHRGVPLGTVRSLLARLLVVCFDPGYGKSFPASLRSLARHGAEGVPRMLFLISAGDRIAPSADICRVAAMVPGARSAVLPGVGHLQGLKASPEEYGQLLTRFLDGAAP